VGTIYREDSTSQAVSVPAGRSARSAITLVVLLWLVMVGTTAAKGLHDPGRYFAGKAEPLVGVDPNSAPWWELASLPDVGEATARAIVEHRARLGAERERPADEPVFDSAADLDKVRGIGPKTVTRIMPHLRFVGYASAGSAGTRGAPPVR